MTAKKGEKRCRKGSKRAEYESPKGKKVRNCIPVKTAWNEILKRKRCTMPKAPLKEVMLAAQPAYKWYKANVAMVGNKVPIDECMIEQSMKH